MGKRFSSINGVAICDSMDGPRGHYAKWNKSVRERQSRIISLICGIQKKNQAHKYKEQIGGCQRWWVGVREMGEGGIKC